MRSYKDLGVEIGELVDDKNRQYGNSVGKTGEMLKVLYPKGLAPEQYDDFLLIVRIMDKMSRISQRGADGKDLGGESPFKDLAGYGLLGWAKDGD